MLENIKVEKPNNEQDISPKNNIVADIIDMQNISSKDLEQMLKDEFQKGIKTSTINYQRNLEKEGLPKDVRDLVKYVQDLKASLNVNNKEIQEVIKTEDDLKEGKKIDREKLQLIQELQSLKEDLKNRDGMQEELLQLKKAQKNSKLQVALQKELDRQNCINTSLVLRDSFFQNKLELDDQGEIFLIDERGEFLNDTLSNLVVRYSKENPQIFKKIETSGTKKALSTPNLSLYSLPSDNRININEYKQNLQQRSVEAIKSLINK